MTKEMEVKTVKFPVVQVVLGWGFVLGVGALGYLLGKKSEQAKSQEATKNS